MGVSLKNIFNESGEDLSVNKSANAIKALVLLAGIVFVFLIIAIVIMLIPDRDKERREKIIQDMKFVQQTIQVLANKHNADPAGVPLMGRDLTDNPQVIATDGVEEEYRYGYYLLTSEDLAAMTLSLNIPNAVNLAKEYYIVNYDTADVINVTGVKFDKIVYHTMDDILLIDKQQKPPKRQIIRTAADLEKIRANPSGVFKLSGNLDMKDYSLGEGWDPIPNFSGTLDGRGYTIMNLKISRPSSENIGLFKEVSSSAKITNLKFSNVSIQGSRYVGVVAGANYGNISYVDVISGSGDVTGNTDYTGGLVGSHANNTISNCTVKLERLNGNSYAGGLVGIVYSGTIKKSGAEVQSIVGKESVGGAIGCATVNDVTYIQEVRAKTENLVASADVGGLIGKIDTPTTKKFDCANCYALGVINSSHERGGGFVGSISCVSYADITMKKCYSAVDLVEKSRTTGGFVGYTKVAGSSDVDVTLNYWLKDIAPGEVLNGVGSSAQGTFPMSFESKTKEQMRTINTYREWDFVDTWALNDREGTPYLKWEKK